MRETLARFRFGLPHRLSGVRLLPQTPRCRDGCFAHAGIPAPTSLTWVSALSHACRQANTPGAILRAGGVCACTDALGRRRRDTLCTALPLTPVTCEFCACTYSQYIRAVSQYILYVAIRANSSADMTCAIKDGRGLAFLCSSGAWTRMHGRPTLEVEGQVREGQNLGHAGKN